MMLFSACTDKKMAATDVTVDTSMINKNEDVSNTREKLKVIAHATELPTVRQAVDADVDMLLHTPMREEFPQELAETIAKKGIFATPILIMMETFSVSGQHNYVPEHYKNAVNLLHKNGVPILTAKELEDNSDNIKWAILTTNL